ncbi:protein FAM71E2 [Echinops telfairi]|uniref:Protein FAM71E2 n=1 Tax=Echinops telfairi TaxID=9371 RepID=A0ABM0ZTI4_ECHTE|nr:protein FAM71E2 [Echinops telfairi]
MTLPRRLRPSPAGLALLPSLPGMAPAFVPQPPGQPHPLWALSTPATMKRLRNLGLFDFLQGPPKWVPILGELQKTLQKGEYLPLHPLPMFESNFVQVTHQGGPVYLHHDSNRLTMGVASTLPSLGLPDILLIARPPEGKDSSSLILTRSQLEPAEESGQADIALAEKPSITIRTIFSIISTTVNQRESSKASHTLGTVGDHWALGSPGHSSEPGEVTLCVTPPRCISQHSPAFSSVVAYDQLEQILLKQDIEDLMDTQSSTLTSSFSPNIHPTAFYHSTPYPSILRHKVKARPPASQKAQSIPVTSGKTPFISDRSQKVKTSPRIPVPSRKVPSVTDPSQKAPRVPVPSKKFPPVPVHAPSHKTPVASDTAQKAPHILVPSGKATPPRAPTRKTFFLPTLSQKALSSPAQYQGGFSSPPSLEKIPAEPSLWLAGSHSGDQPEGRRPKARPLPPVTVSTQKKDVVERRTQERSLELPFSTTKRTSEEVLVSRTREMTIEELKGTGKSEERVIKKKEETTVDLPGLKSKGTEQRKMWVQTTELSLQGPPADHNRPLSVEGLALAKLMIMARSQEQHSRPAVLTLPSWLSINAEKPPVPRVASMSPKCSQLSWLEGSPVVVREQPEPVSWVEQSLQHRFALCLSSSAEGPHPPAC